MQNTVIGKRQRTQQAIQGAGLKLLKQLGTAFTMEDLAQAAGVSRRTLFNHFESKTQLLLSIGEISEARYRATIDEHLNAEATPGEALADLFNSLERQWREQGRSAEALLDALTQARASEQQAEAVQRYADTFKPHLEQWRRREWIATDSDTEAAALLLANTLSSGLFMLRSGVDRALYQRYVNLACSAIFPETKLNPASNLR